MTKPMTAITTEEAGIAWASDAVRDALAKSTPEECKFYLDSLRVMALQLLANECFNAGLGLGAVRKAPTDKLAWNRKLFIYATTNILRSIESRVNVLIKMQKEGKLQLATSTPTPFENVIKTESNVVSINKDNYPETFGDN
jgi:hypothetical protein